MTMSWNGVERRVDARRSPEVPREDGDERREAERRSFRATLDRPIGGDHEIVEQYYSEPGRHSAEAHKAAERAQGERAEGWRNWADPRCHR